MMRRFAPVVCQSAVLQAVLLFPPPPPPKKKKNMMKIDSTVTERYHFVGLVVKASASRTEDPGFESRSRRDFSGSTHTNELHIGTPLATLPGAWH